MNHNNRISFPPLNTGGGQYTMSMSMNMNMNMNDGALMMPPPRSTSNKPLFSAPPPNRPVFKPSKTKTHSSVQLEARWGHTSVVVGASLYVLGGIGNNLVHDTCVYDFGRSQWTAVSGGARSPGARYGHTSVLLRSTSFRSDRSDLSFRSDLSNRSDRSDRSEDPLRPDCILLFGGRNTSKKYFNDIYVLDTGRQQWSYVASDKTFPDARAGHSAALICHPELPFPRLVVFGGNYHNKYLNSVYVMDVVSSEQFQWHKPSVKGTPPCPRSGHTCTPIPNTSKMLVFGGFDGKKCFNDVYIFCAVTFTWTQVTPSGTPPRPRSGHTAALVADRFWVIFGGCSDAVFLNDFHILDLKTGSSNSSSSESNFQWLPPPTLPLTIAPRFHHSCGTVDHSIVIFGGCASGALFNDMVALDVSPLLEMPELFPLSRSTTTDGPINLSRSTNSLLVPSTSTSTTTTASTSSANTTSTDSPLDTTPSSAPTPLSPFSQDIALSPEQKPDAESPLSSSSSIATTTTSPALSNTSRTEPLTTDTPPSASSPLLDPSSSPSSPPTTTPPSVPTSSDSTSSPSSPPSSPSHSSPSPSSLTVMHSIASYNVPDIDLVHSSKNASKLVGFPEDPNKPSSVELCLTAALNSEQQKVKEVELYLAKEKAAHASLRADYVSEQIKVKELEERLFKTEKQLKKAQRGAAEGKTHSQMELQKAHAQIVTLRSELAKKVEKHEPSSSSSSSDRRSHSSRQQHTQHSTPSTTHEQPTTQPSVQQQLSSLLELCTPEHLDPLELPVLMQLQTSSIKASENIAAAKDKKVHQLLASIENLQIDINAKTQACQEKEDAFNNVSTKFSQLQEEHKKEKENLRHLNGEGLENMDTGTLEKLEEIHHTGLRKVGIAKTQVLAQQVARLQREKEELVERVVCVVCCDGQINTILSPCGHRCLCKPCADLLHNCPLCRTPITSKLQYFH